MSGMVILLWSSLEDGGGGEWWLFQDPEGTDKWSGGEWSWGLRPKMAPQFVVCSPASELCSFLRAAHHPRQLCSDPDAPIPHLLPGPGNYLRGGQAGEPEPEEGGDQRGEG